MMLDPSEPIYSDDLTDLAADIKPRLTQPSHAKRTALAVKAGRLALSPGAVAWICSISIHAIVLGAGVWIVTTLVHHANLPNDWGGGGGSSGGLVTGEMKSQITGGMSAVADPAPADSTPVPAPAEATVTADFSGERRMSIDLSDGADPHPFGASATSDLGQPHFRSHRPQPAGGGAAVPQPGPAQASDASEVAGDSEPGMPGALRGSGPPAPEYPPESRRLGERGTVRVAIEVLPDGTVGQIQVVSDPGFARLRDASIKAAEQLRRYKLNPAIRAGRPIREVIVIPYHFKLR